MKKSREQIYDELLVIKCRQADKDAFNELVGRWQNRVLPQIGGRRGDHSVWGDWDKIQYRLVCYLGPLHRPGRCQCGNGDPSMGLADTSQAQHPQGNQAAPASNRRTDRQGIIARRLVV